MEKIKLDGKKLGKGCKNYIKQAGSKTVKSKKRGGPGLRGGGMVLPSFATKPTNHCPSISFGNSGSVQSQRRSDFRIKTVIDIRYY